VNDQAQSLATSISGPNPRRVLRTAWAGAVATVTAGGLLFAAVPSVPAPQSAGGGRVVPVLAQPAAGADVEAGGPVGTIERALRAVTVPEGVSPAQVMAVLDRAQHEAREQGADFSPVVAQAAAELGMLYTTYTAQQRAVQERDQGLRLADAPVARHTQHDDEKGADEKGADEKHDDERSTPVDLVPAGDGTSAVPASYEPASAADPGDADLDTADLEDAKADTGGRAAAESGTFEHDTADLDIAEPDGAHEGTHDHTGWVTFEEVVVAAVRLASLLDQTAPTTGVEVLRAGQHEGLTPREILALTGTEGLRHGPGFSLRRNLLQVVSTFGTTTAGYANGRIPTAVLCPLDFAPGHLLRCDAARQLTVLSDAFQDEFGYPIPITDSYRSYPAQVAVAHTKPHLAAVPGTSNHGWGLAVDLSDPISGGTSPEYVWLRVHGPAYGWDNPSWARPGGIKPEPWHFEFFAAGPVPDRAIDPTDVTTWTPATNTTSVTDQADHKKENSKDGKKGGKKDGKKGGKKDGKKGAGPGREAGAPSKGRPSDAETTKPSKPADKPTTKPTPKPSPSVPAPKPSPTLPSPEPSLPPSPSPVPSPSQEPSPAPVPSQPAPSPTPSAPAPSPSTSASSGLLGGLVRGLGSDRTQD
jgi:hypothetical protein